MMVFVPAILAAVVAAVATAPRASRAADDCLAKPSSAAPQGSHWYYRVDRASRRQCWFLAPEGAKASRSASPQRSPAPTPTPIPRPAAEVVVPQAADAPAASAAVETQAGFAMRWSDLPTSATSIEREPASPGNSYADESSTVHAQDDMPLVWPVLTPADLQAGQQPSAATLKPGNLLALLAGALALAIMTGCAIFERAAARRRRWDQRDSRPDAATDAIDMHTQLPPAVAGVFAAAARPDGVRKSTAAMRRAGGGRAPRRPGDPACDIEQNLQQLLRDWQRVAA
jgi:hypothetical protein